MVTPTKTFKPKILILSDSHGRDLSVTLNNLLNSRFSVQSFFKPNASFEQVTTNINELAKDFNKSDFVVVLAGVNNAIKGNKINPDFFV